MGGNTVHSLTLSHSLFLACSLSVPVPVLVLVFVCVRVHVGGCDIEWRFPFVCNSFHDFSEYHFAVVRPGRPEAAAAAAVDENCLSAHSDKHRRYFNVCPHNSRSSLSVAAANWLFRLAYNNNNHFCAKFDSCNFDKNANRVVTCVAHAIIGESSMKLLENLQINKESVRVLIKNKKKLQVF